jgi:hypothetical protein
MGNSSFSYALANPVSGFLDKPAADFQRADRRRVIAEKGIERIPFLYTAEGGRLVAVQGRLGSEIRDPKQIQADGPVSFSRVQGDYRPGGRPRSSPLESIDKTPYDLGRQSTPGWMAAGRRRQ